MGARLLIPTPVPPIFIVEGYDVGIFACLHDAQRQLEPLDVKNQEYIAYDATGRLLRLETDGKRVIASLAETHPTRTQELETILRTFLRTKNHSLANDSTCGLPTLVEAARPFAHRMLGPKEFLLKIWQGITSRSGSK